MNLSKKRTMNQEEAEMLIDKPKAENEWKQLAETDKPEFQNILGILNRYYSQFSKDKEETQSFLPPVKFRKDVEKSKPEEVSIYLKKFGKYEFLVYVEISGDKPRKDSWIHIDGVQQERDDFLKKGIKTHPVFEITCLEDLYQKATSTTVNPEV